MTTSNRKTRIRQKVKQSKYTDFFLRINRRASPASQVVQPEPPPQADQTENNFETPEQSYTQLQKAAEGIASDFFPLADDAINATPPLDFVFDESQDQQNLTENQNTENARTDNVFDFLSQKYLRTGSK